jgi:hypothetical protein
MQEVLQNREKNLRCMKRLTLRDTLKKAQDGSADKGDTSGSYYSTSSAF